MTSLMWLQGRKAERMTDADWVSALRECDRIWRDDEEAVS